MIRDNIVSPENLKWYPNRERQECLNQPVLVDAINEFSFEKEEEGVHSSSL